MVKITFVVTEITFKLSVVTSSVVKITFVVAEIIFNVVVITSSYIYFFLVDIGPIQFFKQPAAILYFVILLSFFI